MTRCPTLSHRHVTLRRLPSRNGSACSPNTSGSEPGQVHRATTGRFVGSQEAARTTPDDASAGCSKEPPLRFRPPRSTPPDREAAARAGQLGRSSSPATVGLGVHHDASALGPGGGSSDASPRRCPLPVDSPCRGSAGVPPVKCSSSRLSGCGGCRSPRRRSPRAVPPGTFANRACRVRPFLTAATAAGEVPPSLPRTPPR